MEKAYLYWRWFQDKFLAPITAVMFLGPILLAIVEVIRRYVFGVSWSWQQDVVTYTILSAVYIFFAITHRKGGHLRVSLFVGLLEKAGGGYRKTAHLMNLLAHSAAILYLAYFTYYGIKMTQNSFRSGRLVFSQVMPFWPFFLVLTIGIGFMCITTFFHLYREVLAMAGRDVLPEEVESAH
jgi:TRAP-type C4-dicarboxylate transport system permease small subunit